MPSVSRGSGDEWTYVVTDVELDGPWPGVNSMRCFASVAISLDGTEHGQWFGNVKHTHKAIDDAVGFANLLVELSRRVGT